MKTVSTVYTLLEHYMSIPSTQIDEGTIFIYHMVCVFVRCWWEGPAEPDGRACADDRPLQPTNKHHRAGRKEKTGKYINPL